jgi:hypothetical protein
MCSEHGNYLVFSHFYVSKFVPFVQMTQKSSMEQVYFTEL